LCADLKDISRYAQVDNQAYRFMRSLVPGAYTFILPASREVPKMVLTKRRTVGLRVPDCGVCQAVIRELDTALLAVSARGDAGEVIGTVAGLSHRYGHLIDFFVDAGDVVSESSTIIDLTVTPPELLRQGKGPLPGK
jgi:tRNA threonylcarbamoyl adenosine modification protein (Sua5/YciO/YrdC/YwlC family)